MRFSCFGSTKFHLKNNHSLFARGLVFGPRESVKVRIWGWDSAYIPPYEVSALSALFMRVTGLLERADDAEAIDFEVMVLNRYHNVLFDRSAEAVRIEDRLKLLNSKSGPTFESRFTEGLMMMFEACDKIGLFGGEITLDLQGWLEGSIRMAHAWAEACQLSAPALGFGLLFGLWLRHGMRRAARSAQHAAWYAVERRETLRNEKARELSTRE